eukprot:scaffold329923_cov63-Tisochrysis_lutea.AAC.2
MGDKGRDLDFAVSIATYDLGALEERAPRVSEVVCNEHVRTGGEGALPLRLLFGATVADEGVEERLNHRRLLSDALLAQKEDTIRGEQISTLFVLSAAGLDHGVVPTVRAFIGEHHVQPIEFSLLDQCLAQKERKRRREVSANASS